MPETLAAPVYPPVPTPLGRVVTEYWVEPGTAVAYTVTAGQYIQILDVAGCQCSDFLAFDASNLKDGLDATVTRTLMGLAIPQVGLSSRYYSQQMRVLVEVIQDTCGRHDSFLLACTARYYEDAGYPGHTSCSENFNRVLAPHGIPGRPGWPAINFFFNTEVQPDGTIHAGESWSRPGDYVLLHAQADLLCATSACPDDIDPANGWQPTPILVRIYAADQAFPRAIGRRPLPEAPPRLTQDSGFTPPIRALTDHLSEYNGFWVPQDFAGYGPQAEYYALRERVALMDLSVLRKFEIRGPDARTLVQRAFSRNVASWQPGQAGYGCLPNPHGGIIDDGIVFCLGETQFRYVGNCDRDGEWWQKVAQQHNLQATVEPVSYCWHNLALQGPAAREVLRPLTELAPGFQATTLDELGYFQCAAATVAGIPVFLSRTGYTGELGYELFVDPAEAPALWQAVMAAGRPYDLLPLGMQALDIARIEAGLLAAGREFDDLTSPYQAGIGWAVSLKKLELTGRAALEQIRIHPPRVAVGLVLEGPEVACQWGQPVYAPGERWRVGQVTSGTFSPILKRSIALAQVMPEFATEGTPVEVGFVDGQQRRRPAVVGPLAAYDPGKQRVRT